MYRPCVGLTAYCECRCEYAKFGSFFPPTHSPILPCSAPPGAEDRKRDDRDTQAAPTSQRKRLRPERRATPVTAA